MEWRDWENHKAGGAKLSLEEAERYVSELILSRSIALPPMDKNEGCFWPLTLAILIKLKYKQ